MVFTADFISPPVDDPFLFGQIAAANSLSDIFAMGGTPLSCLNLMGFPSEKLDNELFRTNVILNYFMNKVIRTRNRVGSQIIILTFEEVSTSPIFQRIVNFEKNNLK